MSQLVTFKFNGLISLPAPPGVGTRGIAAIVPANDLATIDTSIFSLEYCLSQGLTVAPTVTSTAARPTTNLVPAMQIFDSTLGIPIWRNATNSAWVNSSGSAV